MQARFSNQKDALSNWFSKRNSVFQQRNEKTSDKEARIQRGQIKEEQLRSNIYKLDPSLDDNGIIRVGKRLDILNLSNHYKHLIVFPQNKPLSKLIINWCH